MFELELEQGQETKKQPAVRGIVAFKPNDDKKTYTGTITFQYNPETDSRERFINTKLPDGTFQKTEVVNKAKKGICILIDNEFGKYRLRGTANATFSLTK